ncbi:DUF2239 family protein [Deinococcus yavapaiensis]|uniref:DUF2239 family protein n=1 Tax=Deinococcus yavapaiensis KR-236 TaxID=694435 RepID=A0A318S5V6_9DEIO|nr:DUF2239 family protein [Deinococcus yavapaiensis]PYE49393.1 hypothetical protein DES52_12429 [Deinococcus yavapaiensis KR-236]
MSSSYTLFDEDRLLLTADLPTLLTFLKTEATDPSALLIIDDASGRSVDFDLRGSLEDVLARVSAAAEKTPTPARGRPKLGVVAREVTLLPRHWQWLEAQPGGASATLRRLIDEERKRHPRREAILAAQTAADRFMHVLAGDRPGLQEAARALYARDLAAFEANTESWPPDVRDHARLLAAPAFTPEQESV